MIAFALLACASLQSATTDAEVQAALDQGLFGQAMAASRSIANEVARDASQANVLYLARSYDAALERALAAIDGGDSSALTFSRGVAAATWVGDTTTGRDLLAKLELAIVDLGPQAQPGWRAHAADLEVYLEDFEGRAAGAQAALVRAKWTSGLVGLAALGLLGRGFRRQSSVA
ncbi:MAG: hypothetical protein P1V81_01765 [Planctomycetota bacterium]|nr:hypothetical protein [Planctomycetota bacterium]